MQQVTLSHPNDTPQANKWFATRRKYHTRKLYSLFCKTHTSFTDRSQHHQNDISSFDKQGVLVGTTENKGLLWQLKDLSHNLFPKNTQSEQYGQHLNWALHALFHAAVKLTENIKMYEFHNRDQNQEQRDSGHTAFIERILEETVKQLETLELLFDNARNLLCLMLIDQTGNDLLLRLLIEEENIGQTLWKKSTLELFADMFPYQPEAGYVLAGKSYFMAGWLEEALNAYEKSLALNHDLSEPRRQTYLIRAMIQDRDHVESSQR